MVSHFPWGEVMPMITWIELFSLWLVILGVIRIKGVDFVCDMDNQYHDIMKRTVELAETGLEGLEQIRVDLKEGKYGQAMTLLQDTLDAFRSMEEVIKPILPSLLPNQLDQLTHQLTKAYQLIALTYEQRAYTEVQEIMQNNLLPSYKKWHAELDRSFLPYISCGKLGG